jgi:hypothetical protein
MSILPGVLKPAPSTSPFGSSCASEGQSVGHEDSPIGERSVTVWFKERPRRIVRAAAGGADRADAPLATVQTEDAAVDDVRNLDITVGKQIGVVGMGQIARRAALYVWVTVFRSSGTRAGVTTAAWREQLVLSAVPG